MRSFGTQRICLRSWSPGSCLWTLDPNDENIIIAIPDDIDPSTLPNEEPTRKIKIIQKHVKKSKLLLNRAGIISVVEEESSPPPPKNDA